MPRPTVPQVTEYLYDELKVAQPGDEQREWPWLTFLGGIGAALGRLPDLVRDTDDGPGWSSLLDPDRCQAWALPWLAQFAGVRLTPGASETEQRAAITSPPAFQRGTPDGMLAAVQATLTGAKVVRILERDSSSYHMTVITQTGETPNPAASEAAARSQKPAGLILTFVTSDAPLINEFTRTINAITAQIDSLTVADVT